MSVPSHRFSRFPTMVFAIAALCVALIGMATPYARAADPSDPRFWRIAAGPADSSSFAIAAAVAGGLSSPPGVRACDRGGTCGVPGLIANVQSVIHDRAALDLLIAGQVDGAVLRADRLALLLANLAEMPALRQIAVLHVESLQILVPAQPQPPRTLAELADKPLVWLGPDPTADPLITRALAGIWRLDLAEHDAPVLLPAADLASANLFLADMAGAILTLAPAGLAERAPGQPLSPIALSPGQITQALATSPAFIPSLIDRAAWGESGDLPSIGLPTLLLVRADHDTALAADITKALWHPATLRQIAANAPEGRTLRRSLAPIITLLPLHPGAAQIYEGAPRQ